MIPKIACFNKAKLPLGVEFDALVAALQLYVDKYVAPVWGTPARLVKSVGFVKGAWALVFLDGARKSGTLGYHDLTPEGLPMAKVYLEALHAEHSPVSVCASHELVEMLVDPAANMMTTGPDPDAMYAYEAADPVEEVSFKVAGIPMCDFVYPTYFETFHKPGSVRFDHCNSITKPFQLHVGGYQQIYKRGQWKHVWGSAPKKKRFAGEDRRGHRTEQRSMGRLKPSAVQSN